MSASFIFIHGFRGTHHGLQLITKEFDGDTILVPDLPGFGEGEKLSGYSLTSYVEWLHTYIVSAQLPEKPILIGHSFGSIVTSAYAATYSDTIERLVLICPIGAPALQGPRAMLSKLALFYYRVGEKLPERLSRPWLSSKIVIRFMTAIMAKTNDRALRRYILDQHLQYFSRFHDRRSLADSFNTSISHSVRDVAAHITTKTLLIVGEKDDITPLHDQYALQSVFPSAELRVLEGVGHLAHYEAPHEIAKLIQAFTNRS